MYPLSFTVIFPHRISSSLPLFYYHILLSMFKFTFVCISGAFISCFHKSFDTTDISDKTLHGSYTQYFNRGYFYFQRSL